MSSNFREWIELNMTIVLSPILQVFVVLFDHCTVPYFAGNKVGGSVASKLA
jgi:hypothetical protein